ncbi:hypothetical protein CDO52_15455 [Nocardiopsis gilva YIM 90087]|uniref:Uncharacterized protein n=1 Tax=Nocardiopsis gilva YIM 90087 TaxID=1235441 RepID=A0A223S797_9ACTN|nr:hypothetical protein [Nocardiopsis gilva]ASU83995.1 hypothetical protein CDO52_15455 [Nocardiopsis gilva YIM 90087]
MAMSESAASHAAKLDEARRALAEQFAEHGPPTDDARAWAREALASTGVGRVESAEETLARREALARLDAISAGESA